MRDGGTFQYMGETDAFLDLDVLIYAAWQHTSYFLLLESGLRKPRAVMMGTIKVLPPHTYCLLLTLSTSTSYNHHPTFPSLILRDITA